MRDVPWRMVSLIVGLSALALLLYWSLGMRTTDALPPPAATHEVRAPPADARRDPRAATLYVESETCRAACAATDRSCRAMAVEETDRLAACAATLASCQTSCR